MSGANACAGDVVRNLTTGTRGVVLGSSQFGRLYVVILHEDGYHTERWERWDTKVISV